MMNWSHEMGYGGWTMMAAFWLLLIAGIIWAIVISRRQNAAATTGAEPIELLDRRLASGDIDAATYDQLRRKIRPAPAP